MITLHQAEALRWIGNCDDFYDMIFLDPPDNIGLDYGPSINDNRSEAKYYGWLRAIIRECMGRGDVIWVSYYWKHDLEIKHFIRDLIRGREWEARTFIWNFNFGQYRETDCPNQYRPILRLSRSRMEWSFPKEIRIESERMRLGDPRARGPKVPGDVWRFPRVAGNFVERRAWIPTQHPEALLERIVLMSGSASVLELFTGSGSMIRVAKQVGFDLDTVELNGDYVNRLIDEHPDLTIRSQ